MKKPKKSPDTNQPRKSRGIIGVLLVIGLILLIPLFFVIPIRANAPAKQATQAAATYYVTLTPRPGATSMPGGIPVLTPPAPPFAGTGEKPPACTFPLAQTTTTESAPENYIFSEPVEGPPPNDNDHVVEIVDWLPDNQRVLLVQNYEENDTTQQKIELFNPQTGEKQVYAKREPMEEPPVWAAGLNAVIYPETRVLKSTEINGVEQAPYEIERQLWISRGDPADTQLLDDNHVTTDRVLDFSVAVQPGGNQIVYRTDADKQLRRRDGTTLAAEKPGAFDRAHWDYRGESAASVTPPYLMAWRPGTSQIFLYTYAYGGMGYTFLLDADTGKVCELNFAGWAFFGRWSPDGRYLAIVRAQEPSFPVNSTDLAILDAATGRLYSIGVVPQEMRHGVTGIAWAPDNHHLLVLGSVLSYPGCAPDCKQDTRLYLVDFLSEQVDDLLSSDQFIANNPGTNLAWSPDGSQVLALCPNLCLISVQRTSR